MENIYVQFDGMVYQQIVGIPMGHTLNFCPNLVQYRFKNMYLKESPTRSSTCTELCEAFTFLMENIYVQFDGMVYQQIVGIPVGHTLNFCPNLVQYRFKNMYLKESPTRSSTEILSSN